MGKRSKEADGGSSKKKKKTPTASPKAAGDVTLVKASSSDSETEGGFKAMEIQAKFALLPHCMDDIRVHVLQLLQDQLLRYSSSLGGVPITVTDVALAPGSKHGRVFGLDPHIHVDVRLSSTVFCPAPPQVLPGRINAVSSTFVGLLVHGYFNASINKAELGGLVFDGERWTDADKKTVLAVDTLVLFKLDKVDKADGILSLEGTFIKVVAEDAS